jgi:hypothetical protein
MMGWQKIYNVYQEVFISMTQQDLKVLLEEVEDMARHAYSLGYVSGYSKGKNEHSIETSAFAIVLESKLKLLRETHQPS